MTEDTLVPALFLVTVVLVLVIAGWQYRRARRAQQRGEHSADARVHGDAPSGSSGARTSTGDAGSNVTSAGRSGDMGAGRGAPRWADRDADGPS